MFCTSGDYVNSIYDANRPNFYDYACAFSFANGNATFGGNSACSRAAKEAAALKKATEPALIYREPVSYADYLRSVHSQQHQQQQYQQQATDMSLFNNSTLLQDPARCSNCQPCSIVPCGSGSEPFQSGCGPQPMFQRRMRYNGGEPFKPASALPILDRYQWSQPESLYTFDSDEEFQRAFDGIYNGNTALRAKFNFQNPREQQRLWYGIVDRQSQRCISSEPIAAATSECDSVPVPYYRNYLESRHACRCNRLRCKGACA